MAVRDAVTAGEIDDPTWENRGFRVAGQRVPAPDSFDNEEQLVNYLVGREIVGATYELITEDWQQGKSLFLQLDDGAVLEIAGYGYDACGTEARFWRGGPKT